VEFIEKYIDALILNCKLPKFQNERAISTILQLYLEQIVREKTKIDFEFVTVELPIKKEGSNQSWNVDYFLVSKDRKIGLLVELKTERQGNNDHFKKQIKQYKLFKNSDHSTNDIVKDILFICNLKKRKRSHKIKYENLRNRLQNKIENIKKFQIMYICPNYLIENDFTNINTQHIDYKVKYSELIDMQFDQAWCYIKKYLIELNCENV